MDKTKQLKPLIEALIFASPTPISFHEIAEIVISEPLFDQISIDDIEQTLVHIQNIYSQNDFGFQLTQTAMGWKFVTKSQHYPIISKYVVQFQKKRLSKSALETLSIIAFTPHCTKAEIEAIRGVSADYAIDKLLDRELIEVSGRREAPGQPATYIVTQRFLDYFGLTTLEQLPNPNSANNAKPAP